MSDSSVTVELGERSYPIVFEPLASIGSKLAALKTPGKCVVVSNSVVGPLYKNKVISSLEGCGWNVTYLEIEDGEANKNAETYLKLVNDLLDSQVDRKTPVVAVGGGVTTDIVGFAAATTLRGLPFVNVPTSLLAQVDASVGGKTGVNTAHGKNLLGSFWQPFLVHVAVETLESLSDPEFRCGLGEVVKHAVLEEVDDQPSTAFFEYLEKNAASIVAREPKALEYIIRRCCEIKAAVVSADEREAGKRALLNLGHTIGHAVESVFGYGGLRHGEAVGMGLVSEAQLAVLRGLCDASIPTRISELLRQLSLPTGIKDLDVDALVKASFHDKKREESLISVTMVHAIGDVRLLKITPEDLRPGFEALADNVTGEGIQKSPDSPPVAPNPNPSAGRVSSNAYASGSNQNAGNVLTDRRTTRVHQPPGGTSSIVFG